MRVEQRKFVWYVKDQASIVILEHLKGLVHWSITERQGAKSFKEPSVCHPVAMVRIRAGPVKVKSGTAWLPILDRMALKSRTALGSR